MAGKKSLNDMLHAIVLEHGIEKVERALIRIRKSAVHRRDCSGQPAPSNQMPKSSKVQPKKTKISALKYVSKLDVAREVRVLLEEAADKYENKLFLPTFGEIRNFCSIHGIEVPASHSRVSAIPRIFKHLAQLPPQEIRLMLQSSAFSGPTELAPIANAIRRSSEKRASENAADRRERGSLPRKTETKEKEILKPTAPKNI